VDPEAGPPGEPGFGVIESSEPCGFTRFTSASPVGVVVTTPRARALWVSSGDDAASVSPLVCRLATTPMSSARLKARNFSMAYGSGGRCQRCRPRRQVPELAGQRGRPQDGAAVSSVRLDAAWALGWARSDTVVRSGPRVDGFGGVRPPEVRPWVRGRAFGGRRWGSVGIQDLSGILRCLGVNG
jgi:hypothetical protein